MISVLFSECNAQDHSGDNFDRQREMMVNKQIKARGIKDPAVLQAMLKVERHRFVPEEYIHQAYEDHPLPVGEGQTISQPYIVAVMTEMLELSHNSKVLEIGTGSGYQAAVLAEVCDSVYSIEIFESLAKQAKKTLESLDYKNIFIKTGDGYEGWPGYSPFDAIIVTCAPTHIPQPLKDQLAEGGKMIIPVGEYYAQDLILLEKKNGILREKKVLPVRFVPMIDKKGTKY